MERKITFAIGEYYHIYNRGVDKRIIFLDQNDRLRFQKLLYVANSTKPVVFKSIQGVPLDKIERDEELVAIGAYCLMPNHFHILVKEITEGGVTSFMEKFSTSYSMYFNKKNNRSGFLFQGTFKAEHVDNDGYLKYLYAYIHLNPVNLIEPGWKKYGIKNEAAVKKYLEAYNFSSYIDHLGSKREEGVILNSKEFPGYFEKSTDFDEYIKDWLQFEKDGGSELPMFS